MRQVYENAKLTELDLPELKTITGDLVVRTRPRLRSTDHARAAARVAPSLPCC